MKGKRYFTTLLVIITMISNQGSIHTVNAAVFISLEFEFGENGSNEGQFLASQGFGLNGTHIFASDNFENRIQIFDLLGNYITKFGGSGTGDGQFNNPGQVVQNSTHMFVTDRNNERIQIFDHAANYVGQFGSNGSANGQFFSLGGIALSSDRLFVSDAGNKRIQIFDHSGNYLSQFAGLNDNGFGDVATNSTHLLTTSRYSFEIRDFSGTVLKTITKTDPSEEFANIDPISIEINDKFIFTTDWFPEQTGQINFSDLDFRFVIYDLAGNYITEYKEIFGPGPIDTGGIETNSIIVQGNHIFLRDLRNYRIRVFHFGEYDPIITTTTKTVLTTDISTNTITETSNEAGETVTTTKTDSAPVPTSIIITTSVLIAIPISLKRKNDQSNSH